jgi:beta-lactamase regulating signal transducer with metallopeptidase domain
MMDATFFGDAVRFGAATLVRGSVVIAIGALVATCVGRHAGRASWTWRLVLVAVAALPSLSLALPAWDVSGIDVRHAALSAQRGGMSVAAWICLVWFAGAALALTRLARDVAAAQGVANRASVILAPRVAGLIHRAMSIVGGRRTPVALETDELTGVGLIGWRRPRILLPTSAREWTDDELLGVLCHELEHVRRRDWLMLIVERMVSAVFWMNPLVSLAARSAAGARELVADDAVTRSPVGLDVYADRLIASARTGASMPAAALGFAGGVRVDVRVRALFEHRRDRRPLSARSALVSAVLAVPFVLAVAAAQPWGCVP